jgi:hypothetical protein
VLVDRRQGRTEQEQDRTESLTERTRQMERCLVKIEGNHASQQWQQYAGEITLQQNRTGQNLLVREDGRKMGRGSASEC